MSIVRNFVKIATTGVVIQFVSFLFYPFIGRLYTPEEFGLFSFFTSCVLITSVFVTGQFYYAVTNPKDDEEANQLLSLSVWSVTLFSTAALIAILIARYFSPIDFGWLLFPFYLLFYSLFECFKLITVRFKSFNDLNSSQIINRLGSNLLKIVRPLPQGAIWLLLSEISCFLLSNWYLLKRAKIKIVPLKKLDLSLARKYKDFPLYHSGSLFIQFLLSELPAFYFKLIGEVDLLGYYSMGNRLFIQPCLLIGYSLHPVLIHKFNDKLTLKSVSKVFAILSLISVAALIVARMFHLEIISLLIGKKWLAGAAIYDIQLWMIISKFFMGTVLAIMISQNKSKHLMMVRASEFLALYILVVALDFPFLPTFVAGEIAAELILVALSLKLAGKGKKPIS